MEQSNSRRRFLSGSTAAVAATAAAAATVGAASVAAADASQHIAKKKPLAAAIGAAKGGADNTLTPPLAVRVFHKMGFGPARRQKKPGATQPVSDPGLIFSNDFEVRGGGQGQFGDLGKDDVGYFQSLGSSDQERLSNYVEEQLDPDSIDDSDFDARMAPYQSQFVSLIEERIVAYQNRECEGDADIYLRPYRDVRNMAFNRALYSNKQLFELIVDFWHNHFNVFVRGNRDIEVGWASWDRDVIRANAFGNFANMLVASGKHPVMLRYLNNDVNSAGGINENYARELFELHTLGAENYGGIERPFTGFELLDTNPYESIQFFDMGNFANPGVQIAAHYYDDDVYEAAAGLTGWRYNQNGSRDPGSCDTGEFFTVLGEHDETGKSILSTASNIIPANSDPEAEGELIMRVGAYHPGTATYICRKLCQRLISDNPPEALVQEAAAVFFAFRESGEQIKNTLRVVLMSDAFRDTWAEKTKRPFEYVVSAMRAAGADHVLRDDDNSDNTRRFHWEFDDTRQELFHWATPDGFPDHRAHWEGSTSLIQTWQNIDWILDRNRSGSDRMMRIINIVQENLVGDPTPRELCEFWCDWIMGYTPDGSWVGTAGGYANSPTQLGSACLQFMTQFDLVNPDGLPHFYSYDSGIPRNDLFDNDYPYYWLERMIGMIDLILWSPTFIQR